MSVLLIAEHNNKEIKPFTLNAITAGAQIDTDLHVLLIGNNCGEVARSNDRNNLGVLSSFLYDGLDVISVFNARRLTSVVESVKNVESLMSTPISPDIKEIYKWPLNSLDSLMNERVCDLREEYGIKRLSPEERVITKPLVWAGTIKQEQT